MGVHVGHVVGIRLVYPWTTQHLDGLLLETVPPRPHPLPRRVDDHDVVKLGGRSHNHRATMVRAWGPAPTTTV